MTKEKQLARAKAIAVLECMAIDLTGSLAGLKETNPMTDVLNQRLDAIDVAQEALREQPRWISVEEALPERKGKYLVFAVGSYFGYSIEMAYWTPKYDGFDLDLKGRAIWYSPSEYGDFELDCVAYWMPMPGVPKKEEV